MNKEPTISRKLCMDGEDLPTLVFSREDGIGEAITYIDADSERLHIDHIFVNHRMRRQGIGKAILRSIKLLASDTDMDTVTACIVSRESLDAMSDVFGEDSIRIRRVGEYGFHERGERMESRIPASAWLEFHPKSTPQKE